MISLVFGLISLLFSCNPEDNSAPKKSKINKIIDEKEKIPKKENKNNFKSINIIQKSKNKIFVVAPSKGVSEENIIKLKKIKNLFIPDSILNMHQNKFKPLNWSNNASYKVIHLLKVIERNKNPIIWSLKGGNGASDLDELILKFFKSPPLTTATFIGYSDSTSLHLLFLYLEKKWGKKCFRLIHGALLFESLLSTKNINNFRFVLNIINKNKYPEIDLEPINDEALKCKELKAEITGGNAEVLTVTSCGTYKQIDLINKILILEEIGEAPHAVHRVITKIKNLVKWKNEYEFIKVFKYIKAIIFGNYIINIKSKKSLDQIIYDNASIMKIPVFKTNQIGHGRDNFPWEYHALYSIKKIKNKYKLIKSNK